MAKRQTTPLVPPQPSTSVLNFSKDWGVGEDRLVALQRYLAVLGKWQPKLNLIGPSTWPEVWDRHVLDSLQCLSFMTAGPEGAVDPALASKSFVDVGTGAGFPGVVLSTAFDLPFQLIEADQRKSAFLLAAKVATGAKVEVLTKRVESLDIKPADFLFARAFAPLPRLLDWCAPLITSETTLILHKGRTAEAEISAARETHTFDVRTYPSLIDADSVILRLREVARKG